MSVDASKSVFRPLEEGQVRLIQLLPGIRTAPLRCRLDTVTLKDRPHFNALSYAWGNPERTETLTLDGVSIQVTKNLHVALLHLRHESETIPLWVDGLCICQEDDVEKGRQVSMMGDIFRGARLTWIWLGEASPEDDAVMEYLCTNAETSDARDPAQLPIRALQSFFGRPWFRRLWILQEALFSQQPMVRYGNKQIAFERVVRLSNDLIFENLGNRRGDPFVRCHLKSCLHDWDWVKDSLSERGGWPLVYSMLATEQLECTLFQDRVFALLGLSTESDRKSIEPDYTAPLAELLTKICVYLISSPENPLLALHYMGVGGNSELPSWARDWSKPKEIEWHFLRASGGGQVRWHILPKTQPTGYDWLDVEAGKLAWRMKHVKTITDVACFSDDLRILALKGISVDTVASVHRASTFHDDTASWKDMCESWKTLAIENAKAYLSQKACFDAFCRTLCNGRCRDAQKELVTDCAEAYESWIRGEDESDSGDYGFRTKRYGVGRSFILTKKGFVGLAPGNTQTGDTVCFFKGHRDPFILRHKGGMYHGFVGETLITGMMEGEWIEGAEVGDITEYWIE